MRLSSVSLTPDPGSDKDEHLAARHRVALLISGSARDEVESVARRIHVMQFGHSAPFVAVKASVFPRGAAALQRHLAHPMTAAASGSMFISDVEEMPTRSQDALMKVLSERLPTRFDAVRLITGTTVSLLERIGSGHFSEGLFYRLNVIHVVV